MDYRLCYVFDLDDTLMPTTAIFRDSRNQRALLLATRGARTENERVRSLLPVYNKMIHPDPRLISLLTRLRGRKVLLTNGTRAHAYASLRALGLCPHFYGQVDRNSGAPMKPSAPIYALVQRHMHAHDRARAGAPPLRYVFFDDLVENLAQPKRMGWVTVWITGEARAAAAVYPVPPYVDYRFAHVYDALQFFIDAQRRLNTGRE